MSGAVPVRHTRPLAAAAALVVAAFSFAPAPAAAGLFDDDEARRAILDLRTRLDDQAKARQADQQKTSEQTEQLRRSLLDLNSQLEQQRGENARLRGQIEELTRAVAELQRKQTDIAQGIDQRIRAVEPQKVTLDGREFQVAPDEKRSYEEAMATFRSGDFDAAGRSFGAFVTRWPQSGYRESASFWLGNAQYATKQYKEAIATFRGIVQRSPDSPHAPESLLAIANSQAELKDRPGARKTIDELLKAYPKSEAAVAGKDRLASLR